jgi:hypothetical protein
MLIWDLVFEVRRREAGTHRLLESDFCGAEKRASIILVVVHFGLLVK